MQGPSWGQEIGSSAAGKEPESCFFLCGGYHPLGMPQAFFQLSLSMAFYVPSAWDMVGYVRGRLSLSLGLGCPGATLASTIPQEDPSVNSCKTSRPAGRKVLKLRDPASMFKLWERKWEAGHREGASHLIFSRLPSISAALAMS